MKKLVFLCLILVMAVPAFAIDLKDVELSGMARVRGYEMDNFWDFNSDTNADRLESFRTYATLQSKMKMSDDVAGVIKLTDQTWGSNGTGEQIGENADDRIFLDNAYIDVNNLWCQNLNLRIGRQNVQYGSGFVIFDGKSEYSSTSLYFDGVKANMKFTDKAALDAFYLNAQEGNKVNNPNDDAILIGAYFTGKCPVMGTEKGQQELYVFNRNDNGSNTTTSVTLDKDIWMTGIRLSDKFAVGLDYSAEGAYQFGKFNDGAGIDQDAWGAKLEGGYTFNEAPLTPRLFVGYVFLSGDDPDTKENERWDVMYGGWPQFGDLLAWKYLNVPANTIGQYDSNWNKGSALTGEAVYSNLKMPNIGIGAKFPLNISAQLSYGMLTADETDPGKDDDIGDYYQLSAKYSYSANLDFAAYAAMINPGDAFTYDDKAYEVFWETSLKF